MKPSSEDTAGFRTADGAFAVDLAQRIRAWTPAAERILGYSAQEVLGRRCYEVVAGSDAHAYKFCRLNCPVVVNARRGRPTPDYDILSQRRDGSPAWLNISVLLPDRKEASQPAQVLHVFRDVTRRRTMEEQARKALDALRAVVADDSKDGLGEEPGLPPVPHLSTREREVLHLLALGLTTERIAESLGVSRITTRNHISRVLTKLGVQSRLQAVVYASQRGLG